MVFQVSDATVTFKSRDPKMKAGNRTPSRRERGQITRAHKQDTKNRRVKRDKYRECGCGEGKGGVEKKGGGGRQRVCKLMKIQGTHSNTHYTLQAEDCDLACFRASP